MRVLIIEDEKHTALRLQQLIKEYNNSIKICDLIISVEEAVNWLQLHKHPDIIFQDIMLVDGICFEIYEKIKVSSLVIFTTAYSEYVLRSFEVNSIDYLVKPYDYNDIKRVLEKYNQLSNFFQMPELSTLKELVTKVNITPKRRFLIKTGDNYKYLETGEIAYILSEESLSFACTFSGQRYPVNQSISELDTELDNYNFFRINRKYIINSSSILRIKGWFNGRLKLELKPPPENEVLVSRERVKDFKHWLDK